MKPDTLLISSSLGKRGSVQQEQSTSPQNLESYFNPVDTRMTGGAGNYDFESFDTYTTPDGYTITEPPSSSSSDTESVIELDPVEPTIHDTIRSVLSVLRSLTEVMADLPSKIFRAVPRAGVPVDWGPRRPEAPGPLSSLFASWGVA